MQNDELRTHEKDYCNAGTSAPLVHVELGTLAVQPGTCALEWCSRFLVSNAPYVLN